MQIERLFQVLVVGGALLTGAAMADGPMSVNNDGEELQPIFCTDKEACVTTCSGEVKVKEGFECCWGTSCEDTNQE